MPDAAAALTAATKRDPQGAFRPSVAKLPSATELAALLRRGRRDAVEVRVAAQVELVASDRR